MGAFTLKKKVYYHDTDCGGVVYYANYLKYFEEARTEHFLSKGVDMKELAKDGIVFAVASLEIKYKSPARYGDELAVSSGVEEARGASLYFYHEIKLGARTLAECRTRLVSIGADFKPVAVPKRISALLQANSSEAL